MPEEEASEALESVAVAIEHADENSEPPPPSEKKKGKFKAWMKQSASFMTHVVALIAAFGAFLKTCDHSVTKNAYEALSENITKLSDNQEKLAQDVANMHGYLEGMGHQPMGTWSVPSARPSPSPSPTPMPPHTASVATALPPHLPRPVASTSARITFLIADAGAPIPGAAPLAVALPPASPPPPPVKPPSFATVEAK